MSGWWTCPKCRQVVDDNMSRSVCIYCFAVRNPAETYEELRPPGVPPSPDRLPYRKRGYNRLSQDEKRYGPF